MTFASPLWLLGLLPWAGVAIWLLLGRHRRVAVPFIPLWRGTVSSPVARPSLRRPPLTLVFTILSLLLAVLASGRPMLRSSGGPALTIIVDRGITMSARGSHIERFIETSKLLAGQLPDAIGNGPVQLIFVPGSESAALDQADWTAAAAAATPTLQKSQPALDAAIRRCLAAGQGDLIVVTDQPVMNDRRVIRIVPESTVSNLTIVNVAARASPHSQVMVQLRDQHCATPFRQANVHVESGTNSATQEVQIPRDGTATAFIDLPSLGETVSVNVDATDDLSADNQAWLARVRAAATIEDSSTLSDPLRRMIAVYQRHRIGGGPTVQMVTSLADVPAERPAIVIVPDSSATALSAPLQIVTHPLTANVDWAALTADARGAVAPAGWRVLISKGAACFLAIRDGPTPATWVCINSPTFPLRADFVVFWTNVFDWFGGDGEFQWHPLDGREKPGIEKQSDGSLQAYNAIDVDFPKVYPNDWTRLRSLDRRPSSGFDLTPYACLLALVLMTAAIVSTPYRIQPRTIDSMT